MNTGNLVALMAQPIAKGIDRVFGTNTANCSGCRQMQEDLNAGMSFLDATIKRMKGKYEVQSKH